MFSTFRRAALGAASALLLTGVVAGTVAAAHQTPLIGLTVDGSLVRFTPETACDPSDPVRVSGLAAGETLLAIDERPATRGLYGLGSTSRLYLIDAMTGAATALGTAPFSPALSGSAFGFDFNPTVDRIRIVSNTGQNLRAHPDTGAVVAVDGSLRYAITDVAAGHDPDVVGAAYTNPDIDPATGTTLFDLDAVPDALVVQAPPNDGVLGTVGRTTAVQSLTGFDIAPGNTAFVASKVTGGRAACGSSNLSVIDLGSGAEVTRWSVGTTTPLRGLAVDLRSPF